MGLSRMRKGHGLSLSRGACENPSLQSNCLVHPGPGLHGRTDDYIWMNTLVNKGRHCCSVGELKITFASTCKESVFNVLFNVLFLVLDFPLGAPYTLLKHVIERSIWRIVVGEGSWWGWGFSQDWWLGFWSCWNLSLTAVFWIDFSVTCFKRV